MEMTGAQILVEGMLREGVEKLFGYAGATICPLADVLRDTPQLDYTLDRFLNQPGSCLLIVRVDPDVTTND